MPISITEYQLPRWVRLTEKKPFIEDEKAKFMDGLTNNNNLRRFHGESFPQPGYNVEANSPNIRPITLDKDEVSLPPYM